MTVTSLKALWKEVHVDDRARFKDCGKSYQYKVMGNMKDQLDMLFRRYRMNDDDALKFLDYVISGLNNERSFNNSKVRPLNEIISERIKELPLQDRDQFIK